MLLSVSVATFDSVCITAAASFVNSHVLPNAAALLTVVTLACVWWGQECIAC